ncbi:MAG: hypothetical protein A2219_07485 [Elusimicrobia bacterium RIFOXYA2_FULL_50_26]|nr:MAG: hypothetical protein A2219_07485 [Elusimicrobia bacterium RIFOXYA2_FULL_50_26]OGS23118.1 MAG: hypothetical protein A2314_04735 [Elusimicrobia bacterium RIFOXYB2_FULL_50_12]
MAEQLFDKHKQMITAKNLFIAGKHGVGKTTLIREVVMPFRERAGGFYTEEIRDSNGLRGFRIKTFDGREGILAHKGMKSAVKLNKYGIDPVVLDTVGVAAVCAALREKDVVVIDEIGSIDIVSDSFRAVLMEVIRSPKKVLATVRLNAQPFTDEIKRMPDTAMLMLSRDKFTDVKQQVTGWIKL